MSLRGVDHVDLAVSDVERSLAFYLRMLGPLGLDVEGRFQTYRETEEVVYLGFGQKFVPGAVPETRLGLRKADGGRHDYYGVGIEHLAFTVESIEEVDGAYQRCLDMDARIHCPPEEEPDLPGYYAFFVFPTASASRSATGPIRFAGNGMPESTSRLGRIERATDGRGLTRGKRRRSTANAIALSALSPWGGTCSRPDGFKEMIGKFLS